MGRLLSQSAILTSAIVILALCVLASGMLIGRTGVPPDAAQGFISTTATALNGALAEGVPVMLTAPPVLDGLVNDQPAAEAFIPLGDPDGTTLVESTFDQPLDMNESNANSANGDEDQPQEFNDIASHMSSTSSQTDDAFNLDDLPNPVVEPSEPQWRFQDPQSLDQQTLLNPDPPFEGQQPSDYERAVGQPSYPQPTLHSQPLLRHQPLGLHQPLPPQMLHQNTVPRWTTYGAADTHGELLPLHTAGGTGRFVESWKGGMYVPGQGRRPLQEKNIFTNQHGSSRHPLTTSLPELDLQATACVSPTLVLGAPSGRLDGMIPSFAAPSSDPTALTSHASAVSDQTDDSSHVQCSECPAKFDGKRKKQNMLLHYDHEHGIRDGKAYRCPDCKGAWCYPRDLRKHRPVHTRIKNYRCPECPELFTRLDNWRRHMRKSHPGHRIAA